MPQISLENTAAISNPMPESPPTQQASLPWLKLREELKLAKGPHTRHGTPTWTIHDPSVNQFFSIGWLEFEILNRWNLGSPEKIAQAIEKTSPLQVSLEQVEQFAKFLQHHNLLCQSFPGAATLFLKKMTLEKKGWIERIFKNYLYFKIPMVHPDKFLATTLPLLQFMFNHWFFRIMIVISLAGIYMIAGNWSHFINGFDFLATPEGASYFMAVLFFSKCCHELGHGYAARHYGCSVPKMGIGLIVFWPILWTDTTDAWKITDKKKRLIISGAGMYAEIIVAALASMAWALLEDGTLRSCMQMLAATTWVLTITVNLNPVMKFDGYFLMSDWFELPNLQSRSILFFRWWYRKKLYGFDDPPPEYPDDRDQRFMVIYAFSSWIYRFFIMMSIALAIYLFFFKALGLLLICVQIVMFPIIPLLSEITLCWKNRSRIKWVPNFIFTLFFVLAIFAIFIVPWKNTITSPSILVAKRENIIYAPAIAKIAAVHVKNNQQVNRGNLLFTLQSPYLDHNILQTQRRITQIKNKMAANQLHDKRIEQNMVMIQERHTLEADLTAFLKEKEKLLIYAPFEGSIVDVPDNIHPGDWIARKEILGLLVQSDQSEIIAFVPEKHLAKINIGQNVRFYPDGFQFKVISGQITQVNYSGVKSIKYPELASLFGGSLPVQRDYHGTLIPVGSYYKILIQPDLASFSVDRVTTGLSKISIQPVSLLQSFWIHALGVLIRESGL